MFFGIIRRTPHGGIEITTETMKTRLSSFVPFAAAALFSCCVSAFLAGCESAESHSVEISPGYSQLKAGQSVSLTASGWDDFSWDLDTSGIGHLSKTTGRTVVFTAESGVSNGTVTVTATAIGSGSNSSTNSAAGYSATATIDIVE